MFTKPGAHLCLVEFVIVTILPGHLEHSPWLFGLFLPTSLTPANPTSLNIEQCHYRLRHFLCRGCQRLTSHSQTIASVCVTKCRQLKPSTFILRELIVIQGSSAQIMGHRETVVHDGGRGLLGEAHSSLSVAHPCELTPGLRLVSL